LQDVSLLLLRFHSRADVQIPQRVKKRDEKQHEKNEGNEAKKNFAPAGILKTLRFKGHNFLMGFAKVRRGQRFANTLEAGIEDMEAARHGCYINEKNLIRSMVKTVIRHAVAADFGDLLEIDQASFVGGVAYDAAELSYFINRDDSETLVLEQDRQIVAFLILEVHQYRRWGSIVTLDVREGYRRNGYGTQLMKRAEDIFVKSGIEAYDLQVDVNNRPAITFYKKYGFRTVRTLCRYYANGNDAFLMVKEL
jgi:ribosomal-protein-alanine N-acetyltransferase